MILLVIIIIANSWLYGIYFEFVTAVEPIENLLDDIIYILLNSIILTL